MSDHVRESPIMSDHVRGYSLFNSKNNHRVWMTYTCFGELGNWDNNTQGPVSKSQPRRSQVGDHHMVPVYIPYQGTIHDDQHCAHYKQRHRATMDPTDIFKNSQTIRPRELPIIKRLQRPMAASARPHWQWSTIMPCIDPSTLLCLETKKVCPGSVRPGKWQIWCGCPYRLGQLYPSMYRRYTGIANMVSRQLARRATQTNFYIINAGDQIAQLTHNHFRSALHRVVTPNNITKPRYSTAFFTYFGIHARVGPLPRFVGEDNETPTGTALAYFHYKRIMKHPLVPRWNIFITSCINHGSNHGDDARHDRAVKDGTNLCLFICVSPIMYVCFLGTIHVVVVVVFKKGKFLWLLNYVRM